MAYLHRLSPPQMLVLSFIILIMTGSILLMVPWATQEGTTSFLTALFTATSAACVTGLVVVDTGTHWTFFGQFIILLLMQIGGLSIMSFVTFFALILGKKIGLKQRLIMQQSINQHSTEGIVKIFKYLLFFSFAIEIIAGMILAVNWASALGWLDAIWFGLFHSVSAFNNAGFDLFGNFSSLTGFTTDVLTNLIISGLFIVGGLGFVVIYELFHLRKSYKMSLHSKLVILTTLFLIVIPTLIFAVTEYNHALSNLSPSDKFLAAFFQAVTPRTAGFNTIDLNMLYPSTQLIIMALMFIGGSPGSTAGGIKTTTFILLWISIYSILSGKRHEEIMKRQIPNDDSFRALTITLLALFLIFCITVLISFTNEADLMQILFEVISAMGTVGLSLGLTTKLNGMGQILIIITMLLGRLGPITIGYSLAYKRKHPNIHYPKGRIMIG